MGDRIRFYKLHGAGNDMVLLDATRQPVHLTAELVRRLGDRRFGVGCDQVLLIEPSLEPGVDLCYRIFNGADGGEVEHCGNGARCVALYLDRQGRLGDGVVARTVNRTLSLRRAGLAQGQQLYTAAMGVPKFVPAATAFDASGLPHRRLGQQDLWWLTLADGTAVELGVASLGNPHAVLWLGQTPIEQAPVERLGAQIEHHPRFAARVNVGLMGADARAGIALRVWERSAGETLACGSGACAAALVAQRSGLAMAGADGWLPVQARGGRLAVRWLGDETQVELAGPAQFVFEGEFES